jgi:hypothetical protein
VATYIPIKDLEGRMIVWFWTSVGWVCNVCLLCLQDDILVSNQVCCTVLAFPYGSKPICWTHKVRFFSLIFILVQVFFAPCEKGYGFGETKIYLFGSYSFDKRKFGSSKKAPTNNSSTIKVVLFCEDLSMDMLHLIKAHVIVCCWLWHKLYYFWKC